MPENVAKSAPPDVPRQRPHPLSRAPADFACPRSIRRKEGSTGPCGRWVVGAGGDRPEMFCVAHSSSKRAKAARSRSAEKRKADERRVRRARREELLDEWIGGHEGIEQVSTDFRQKRGWLFDVLFLGEITVAECRELRALIHDDELSAQHAAEVACFIPRARSDPDEEPVARDGALLRPVSAAD